MDHRRLRYTAAWWRKAVTTGAVVIGFLWFIFAIQAANTFGQFSGGAFLVSLASGAIGIGLTVGLYLLLTALVDGVAGVIEHLESLSQQVGRMDSHLKSPPPQQAVVEQEPPARSSRGSGGRDFASAYGSSVSATPSREAEPSPPPVVAAPETTVRTAHEPEPAPEPMPVAAPAEPVGSDDDGATRPEAGDDAARPAALASQAATTAETGAISSPSLGAAATPTADEGIDLVPRHPDATPQRDAQNTDAPAAAQPVDPGPSADRPESASRHCPNCAAAVAEGDRFCGVCGTQMP